MIIGINSIGTGAGKSTLAMLLQALSMSEYSRWYNNPVSYAKMYEGTSNLKGGWPISAYGDYLKAVASILTGFPQDMFNSRKFKRSYLGSGWNDEHCQMTVREFLLKLGDSLRNLNKNVFVNALFAKANLSQATGLIIPDVRRINEYQAIKDRGGILVRIVRDKNPHVEPSTLQHPTEAELVDYPFDYIVKNNGSLEDLAEEAKKIMETIKSK